MASMLSASSWLHPHLLLAAGSDYESTRPARRLSRRHSRASSRKCQPAAALQESSRSDVNALSDVRTVVRSDGRTGVRAVVRSDVSAVVRRRDLAAGGLLLSLPSWIPDLLLNGHVARADVEEVQGTTEKRKNLSIDQLKDIIAGDIQDRQYFVTGQLTRSIYREDCQFVDPTNTTVGVDKYIAALGILFDPEFSKHELISIDISPGVEGRPSVEAKWRLGGYLKFPWNPRVVPFTGSTRYEFDNDGLVAIHKEEWSISPGTALLETFTPNFGPKSLL